MVNGPFFRVIILAGLFRHPTVASRPTDINPLENEAIDDTEAGVTCYTCVNVSDNSMCNEFAIDHPCPKGQNFCHTLHIMDSTGASVIVNKKCADSEECLPQSVGCYFIDSQTMSANPSYKLSQALHMQCICGKVCSSCCDEMYCNVTVPTNKTTAVYSSTRKGNRSKQYPVLSNTRVRSSDSTATSQSYYTLVPLLSLSFWL